jgi:hypothetical protein
MKPYTDLEQSKKLAEILPVESADMWWSKNFIYYNPTASIGIGTEYNDVYAYRFGEDDIPCWSLAALLDVLPQQCHPIKNLILGKPKDKWCVLYWDATGMEDGEQTLGDNPVDACYEMILKLHELKIL